MALKFKSKQRANNMSNLYEQTDKIAGTNDPSDNIHNTKQLVGFLNKNSSQVMATALIPETESPAQTPSAYKSIQLSDSNSSNTSNIQQVYQKWKTRISN